MIVKLSSFFALATPGFHLPIPFLADSLNVML